MINLNRRVFTVALVASLTAAAANSATAGIIAYEGFNYNTNSSLAGQVGGSGWSGAWQQEGTGVSIIDGSFGFTNSQQVLATTGQAATISSGNIAYRSLNTLASGPFSGRVDTNGIIGKDGTSLWASFLFTPLATNDAFAGVDFTLNGAPVFSFGFDDTTTDFDGATFNFGQTYFVVERFIFGTGGNDTIIEYINPKPGGGSPSNPDGVNSYSSDFGFTGVDFAAATGNGTASFAVDEFRFGATYQDVAPLPPIILSNLHVSAGMVTIQFTSLPEQDHLVQTIFDLAHGTWETFTNLTGDGSVITLHVPVSEAPSQQFFRVVSSPGNAGGPS